MAIQTHRAPVNPIRERLRPATATGIQAGPAAPCRPRRPAVVAAYLSLFSTSSSNNSSSSTKQLWRQPESSGRPVWLNLTNLVSLANYRRIIYPVWWPVYRPSPEFRSIIITTITGRLLTPPWADSCPRCPSISRPCRISTRALCSIGPSWRKAQRRPPLWASTDSAPSSSSSSNNNSITTSFINSSNNNCRRIRRPIRCGRTAPTTGTTAAITWRATRAVWSCLTTQPAEWPSRIRKPRRSRRPWPVAMPKTAASASWTCWRRMPTSLSRAIWSSRNRRWWARSARRPAVRRRPSTGRAAGAAAASRDRAALASSELSARRRTET